MDPKIIAKLDQYEEESRLYNRCINQDICPHCGGDLVQDSDIGTFVEVQCSNSKCDFEFTKPN